MLDVWAGVIASLIEIIRAGIDSAKALLEHKSIQGRDLTVKDVKSRLDKGSLQIGDKVTCLGTFCQFLPFVDLGALAQIRMTKKPASTMYELVCSCRMDSINDMYCGALYMPEITRVSRTKLLKRYPTWIIDKEAEPSLPLFYSKMPSMLDDHGLKLANFSNGDVVELECQLVELPDSWRTIIQPSSSFTCEDSELETSRAFGLRVLDVKPYGTVLDQFLVDFWLAGHLDEETYEAHLKHDDKFIVAADIAARYGVELLERMPFRLRTRKGQNRRKYSVYLVQRWIGPSFLMGMTDVNIFDKNIVGFSQDYLREIVRARTKLRDFGTAFVDIQYDEVKRPFPASV